MLSVTAFPQGSEQALTADAQLRSRGEYRNGALMPRNEGDQPAVFVNERARLSLQYDRSDLAVRLSAQHTGVWGQDPQVDKQGRMAVSEAWARLKFDHGLFFVQAGRQPLVYDDERILGSLDWNVAGRFHDALKVGYDGFLNQAHLILAFNQNDERVHGTYYDRQQAQPYKSMQALWYHFKSDIMPLGVSVLGMNVGTESGTPERSSTEYMQTVGTHITYQPSSWQAHASFYYQTGKERSAWMASVGGSYRINDEWDVSAGYDILSGDDSDNGKTNDFNPLYGTHHKFYGAMDLFYASPFAEGQKPGLQDFQASVKTTVVPKVPMQLNYHYFASAAKMDGSVCGLGHEVDYQLSYGDRRLQLHVATEHDELCQRRQSPQLAGLGLAVAQRVAPHLYNQVEISYFPCSSKYHFE